MTYNRIKLLLATLLMVCVVFPTTAAESLKDQIASKKTMLQDLMSEAEGKSINTEREKCVVWMTDEFSKYADWDEANVAANKKHFEAYTDVKGSAQNFKEKAQEMAEGLATFEREEIIKMLDDAIAELKAEMNGEIKRPAAVLLDWKNIERQNDQYVAADGRTPVFVHDYFSKPKDFRTDYTGHLESTSIAIAHTKNENEVSPWKVSELKQMFTGNAGYIMLWHGIPAKWMLDKDPEIRHGQRNFTLYDIDNPIVRKGWETVCSQMLPALVKNGKPVNATNFGFVMANEPHWYTSATSYFQQADMYKNPSVSVHTMEKFIEWLEAKYGNINNLNRAWKERHATFSAITITLPFNPNTFLYTPKAYDWQRFNMDRVNDWFTHLHTNITKVIPDAGTQIKVMPHCWTDDERDHGLDFEYLTELSNVSGNDAQMYKETTWNKGEIPWWKEHYAFHWKEMMAYDFFKSVKPDQPIINSEGHYLSTSRFRDPAMSPAYVRTCFWYATFHGMNSCYSWFWARESDTGAPSEDVLGANSQVDNAMSASYAASVVQQPRVANEVTQTYYDMNAISADVVQFQRARRPMRIFYSEACAIAQKTYMTGAIFPLYESLNFEGTSLGFATQRIIEKQDNKSWKCILVYNTEYATDVEFAALQSYLDQGGVVIKDARSLTKNEYGTARTTTLNTNKGGTIVNVNTLAAYKAEALKYLGVDAPTYYVEETNTGGAKGCEWRVAQGTNGHPILYVVNLGKSEATLTIKSKASNTAIVSRNMLTNQPVASTFKLPSEEVIILELTSETSFIDPTFQSKVQIHSTEKNTMNILNARGESLSVSNLVGQVVAQRDLESNNERLTLPTGLYVAVIPNLKSQKVYVQ